MILGHKGIQWISDIRGHYTDGASLCSEWQQTFFENFWQRTVDYEDGTTVSEKQLVQLNKIADIYGVENMSAKELDDDQD